MFEIDKNINLNSEVVALVTRFTTHKKKKIPEQGKLFKNSLKPTASAALSAKASSLSISSRYLSTTESESESGSSMKSSICSRTFFSVPQKCESVMSASTKQPARWILNAQ